MLCVSSQQSKYQLHHVLLYIRGALVPSSPGSRGGSGGGALRATPSPVLQGCHHSSFRNDCGCPKDILSGYLQSAGATSQIFGHLAAIQTEFHPAQLKRVFCFALIMCKALL